MAEKFDPRKPTGTPLTLGGSRKRYKLSIFSVAFWSFDKKFDLNRVSKKKSNRKNFYRFWLPPKVKAVPRNWTAKTVFSVTWSRTICSTSLVYGQMKSAVNALKFRIRFLKVSGDSQILIQNDRVL